MPDNGISQQPAQGRYNLRNSKRAGVKKNNSGQSDADRHESTGEPSRPSATGEPSQASGTGLALQAGSTGIASQAGDSVGIQLSAEISRGLIARGMLNNQPTSYAPVTDEEMEQAGLGDLSAEFRAYAQNSWFMSAFVKSWDRVGWNGERRED